jgi:hypothetical protein
MFECLELLTFRVVDLDKTVHHTITINNRTNPSIKINHEEQSYPHCWRLVMMNFLHSLFPNPTKLHKMSIMALANRTEIQGGLIWYDF